MKSAVPADWGLDWEGLKRKSCPRIGTDLHGLDGMEVWCFRDRECVLHPARSNRLSGTYLIREYYMMSMMNVYLGEMLILCTL